MSQCNINTKIHFAYAVMDTEKVHHYNNVGWLVVLRIYVALAVFQPYRDLETGDNQWRGRGSNPGHRRSL